MHVPLANGHADLDRNLAVVDDRQVKLSPNEAKLFRYLAERPGQTVDSAELLTEVFGYAPSVRSRTATTTMQRLRKKIEVDPAEPIHFLSVYGRGYCFEPVCAEGGMVGRGRELAELRERLKGGRLWIVAPGGYGKSTLARRFAELAGPDALRVDLTDQRSEADLIAAVAKALGVPQLEELDALQVALQHRAAPLLLLDAAEAMGDLLVPHARRWAGHTPVLVTSRRPCADEPTLQLGPLPPRDAARVLARHAPPDLPPGRLEALIEGLQGVPLALELAGARLAVFSPEELAAHLDDLDTLLAGGEGRQASMHTVLDWSWHHTPAPLREALGRLTAARQGLAIADAVTLLGRQGLSLVGDLQRWGWIQRAEGRVLLLDPVRQFVEPLIDHADARRRHLSLFLHHDRAGADDLLVGRSADFMRTEWANLHHALDQGLADGDLDAVELLVRLAPALLPRLPTARGIAWLDRAIELSDGSPRAAALLERASLWMTRASVDAGAHDVELACQIPQVDPGMLAYRRGQLLRQRGDLDAAVEHYQRACATLPTGWALHAGTGLGYTLLAAGKLSEAEQTLRGVLARARVHHAPIIRHVALGTLGYVYTAQDRFDEARAAYEEALRDAEAIGYDVNLAGLHSNLANLLLYSGDRGLAHHHWSLARREAERLGNRRTQAMSDANLAQLDLIDRKLDLAEQRLRSALAVFDESGSVPEAAFARLALGRHSALSGAVGAAEGWWDRAEPDLPRELAWMIGVERCMARAEAGDAAGARQAWEEGEEGPDAGARSGRAVAAGFWHAASVGSGSRDDDKAHREAVNEALRAGADLADPMLQDMVRRLREMPLRRR